MNPMGMGGGSAEAPVRCTSSIIYLSMADLGLLHVISLIF